MGESKNMEGLVHKCSSYHWSLRFHRDLHSLCQGLLLLLLLLLLLSHVSRVRLCATP